MSDTVGAACFRILRRVASCLVLAFIGLIIFWMPDRFVRGADTLQLWVVAYRVLGFVCLCFGVACLFARYLSRRPGRQPTAFLESPPNSAKARSDRTSAFTWWRFAIVALIAVAIHGFFINCAFHRSWTAIPGHRGQRSGVGAGRRRVCSAVHDEV